MALALFQAPLLESTRLLLDALLPIQGWAEKNEYPPTKQPWETGPEKLNAVNLKICEYIEALAEDESKGQPFYAGQENAGGDADMLVRFRKVHADPLQAAADASGKSTAEVLAIRSGLSLSTEMRFSPAVSDNSPVAEPDVLHWLQPASRKELYEHASDSFKKSVEALQPTPGDKIVWSDYAKKLMSPSAADHAAIHWPHDAPVEAREFAIQLLRDALVTVMNMDSRRTLPGHPKTEYRDAVLIELGEHRRPGKASTDGDAVKAVSTFMKELTKTLGGSVPAPASSN